MDLPEFAIRTGIAEVEGKLSGLSLHRRRVGGQCNDHDQHSKYFAAHVPSLARQYGLSVQNLPLPQSILRWTAREIRFLIRFRFETEVDGLGFVAADGHILSLSSVVLMPGGDR